MSGKESDEPGGERLELRLRLPFSWDCIEPVRQAVAAAVTASLGDTRLAEQLAMVASELLENAVKHGVPGPIEFDLHEEAGALAVTVKNAVAPDAACTDQLAERLEFLRQFPSAQDAYLAAMTAVYEQGLASASSTQSTLGLARIAAEGECRLQWEQERPGRVTVRALRCLPGPEEAGP